MHAWTNVSVGYDVKVALDHTWTKLQAIVTRSADRAEMFYSYIYLP